jgi:hypothetical protein
MMAPNADTLCPPLLSNCVRHDLHALTIPSASSRTARSRRRLHPGTTAGREPSGGSNCGRGRRHRARPVQRPHTAALSRRRRRAPSLAGERLAAPAFFSDRPLALAWREEKDDPGSCDLPASNVCMATWPHRPCRPGPPGALFFFLFLFFPPPTGIAAGPAHFSNSAQPSQLPAHFNF